VRVSAVNPESGIVATTCRFFSAGARAAHEKV